MGLYDRDYLRNDDQRQGVFLSGNRSMVANLIIMNVIIFFVDVLLDGKLSEIFALQADVLRHPWNLWQLLTYGFLHATNDMTHIVMNMIGLFFFGREIEAIYGRREFLVFYLVSIVFGGAVWVLSQTMIPDIGPSEVIGASGAVTAVTMLFVLHYPFRTILLFGFLPMPAWLLGALFILQNVLRMGGPGIAYEVHLAGALFAFLYWQFQWRLAPWMPQRWPRLGRPKLRVHDPSMSEPSMDEPNLQRRVDQILAKISAEGESSLTREERRILEDASRRYQRRRQ